ncbi:helix-turn-helix domain-containing protein [Pelagibius sp. Alg239-R121]|uniref:helix-turn-helix domain-containing protein n=1 Tax=Pelagibius sp. Alg239-R121 TaxID=2993448 RepID=UPI0024A63964|nr:helix-turn-helix domain-containing protein [Pelagibius sp. Alg239-R121]
MIAKPHLFLLLALIITAQIFAAQSSTAQAELTKTGGPWDRCAALDSAGAPALPNGLTERQEDQLRPLSLDFFLDPTGTLDPTQITTQTFEAGHCALLFEAPRPGEALWFRFTVLNEEDSARQWFVTFMEYIFDEALLFEQQQNGLVMAARNGRTFPIAERADNAVKTGFPLTVQPGEERIYYLRIAGTFAPTITPAIMTAELFSEWSVLSLVMTAIFLGYVGAIALLSLFLFRHVEPRFYLYYALYMACFFVFSFIYDSWLAKFTGVTLPVTVMSRVGEFIAGLGVFANIQYCRVLLKVDEGPLGTRRLFLLLSAVAVITTGLAAYDPWGLSAPLHIAYFASPLVLLTVSLRKTREGLPQAKFVSGSLLSLTLGLCIAVYFFTFPIQITQAAVAFDLILQRPLTWGYYLAIMGETTFMILAISAMVTAMQAEKQTALERAETLLQTVNIVEQDHAEATHAAAEASKTAKARIEALEASLVSSPEKNLLPPAEQRFSDNATECVLDHIGEEDFGARELADALSLSPKTLGRRLKATHGLAPAAFIRSIRLNFARDLILARQYQTVAEVSRAAGFASVGHFAKLYRAEFGQTPSDEIKAGAGAG